MASSRKSSQCNRLQLAGDIEVVAKPEDGRDHDMIELQPELPLLADISRERRLRPADIHDAVHLAADGVLDFLMKPEPARQEHLAVEPHGDTRCHEIGVETMDERFVIGAGVGDPEQEDSNLTF